MKPIDNTSSVTIWDAASLLEIAPEAFTGTADNMEEWKLLRAEVARLGQENGWTKSDIARRIDMPVATFSQWLAGNYGGRWDNQNAKVERWLAAMEDAAAIRAIAPKKPDFVRTPSATKFLNALTAAQALGKFTMVTSAPGTGKTEAAQYYAANTPLVMMATMCPMNGTTFAMLKSIARAVGLTGGDPSNLVPSISDRLWKTDGGALLIIDEAQHLSDDAINQARHFSDGGRAGVVLLGNQETYGRFANVWMKTDRYGQLASRVFQRINIIQSSREDILQIIEAWNIKEEKQVAFLAAIGKKPGGLRHIGETVTLAMMQASDSKAITLSDLKKAWNSRGLEAGL